MPFGLENNFSIGDDSRVVESLGTDGTRLRISNTLVRLFTDTFGNSDEFITSSFEFVNSVLKGLMTV